jgi:Tol biopolymer transport system component
LKPENVMESEEGRVKVLDFGLAKLRPEFGLSGSGSPSELPTATEDGRIVGTVAYMSPEQAEGKPVDARSDIFSLGILLYEMATGVRPFRGDSATAVLSAIIKDTPVSVTELRPSIPRDLAKIIRRCLSKDPLRRFQSAIDLRNELEECKSEVDSGEAVASVAISRKGSRRWWLAAAGVLAAALGVVSIFLRQDTPRSTVPRLVNPVQLTFALGVEDFPTWSPDGRTLAYTATPIEHLTPDRGDIWVTQTGKSQPVNRTADHPGGDCCPSWSPDGSEIAFWSAREGGGYFIMSALGGPARKVLDLEGATYSAPQWSLSGEELAAIVVTSEGCFVEIVNVRTRESRRLPLSGRRNERLDLAWSRDGRFFAYGDGHHFQEVTRLWVLRLSDGLVIPLTDGLTKVWSPAWSSDGRQLYFVSNRGGSMDLWSQKMAMDGTPAGEPQPVTVGLEMRHAAFSRDGTQLAYSRGRPVGNVFRVPILEKRSASWDDAEQITFEQAFVEFFDVSPDGERLALNSDRSGNPDLWILTMATGELIQLTSESTPDWHPTWSPDGRELAFYSFRSGNREVWVLPLGGGPARQLTEGRTASVESVGAFWSPSGREIAFARRTGVKSDIYVVPAEGGASQLVAKSLSGSGFNQHPSWSPDEKSLVFSADGFLWRVPAKGGEPERLTKGPARYPRWSRDGRHIFFTGIRERAGNVWALSYEDGTERPVTDLKGRPGRLGDQGLATDGRYLYFRWEEDTGDIWVMDVVAGGKQ